MPPPSSRLCGRSCTPKPKSSSADLVSLRVSFVKWLTFVLATCALVVTACDGGSSGGTHSSTSKGVSTPVPSVSTTSARQLFARHVINTQIGDPVTVDVCATLGLSLFTTLGYKAVPSDGQRPASCQFI